MSNDEKESRKHDLAIDLAHEVFLPSYALTLEDAEPRRLYDALADKGYVWTGDAWKTAKEATT